MTMIPDTSLNVRTAQAAREGAVLAPLCFIHHVHFLFISRP